MTDIVWASLIAQQVKNPPAMQETRRYCLGKTFSLHLNILVYLVAWHLTCTWPGEGAAETEATHDGYGGPHSPLPCDWLQRDQRQHMMVSQVPTSCVIDDQNLFLFVQCGLHSGLFCMALSLFLFSRFFFFFPSFSTVTIYDAFNVVNY